MILLTELMLQLEHAVASDVAENSGDGVEDFIFLRIIEDPLIGTSVTSEAGWWVIILVFVVLAGFGFELFYPLDSPGRRWTR